MKGKKDFWPWMSIKKRLHERETGELFFREREIWWCALGANIGHEQDGTGRRFDRPVVILKKFNRYVFLGVPLTTRPKVGRYYLPVGTVDGKEAVAILSQIRFLDRKRLLDKIGTVAEPAFADVKKAVKNVVL
jgi:mRNA interferase MazF